MVCEKPVTVAIANRHKWVLIERFSLGTDLGVLAFRVCLVGPILVSNFVSLVTDRTVQD